MISKTGWRLYARYKANSGDLFKNINDIYGKSLKDFQSWSPSDIAEYRETLQKGYIRNWRCYTARQTFRDVYVAKDKRDKRHEWAIECAMENCTGFGRLMGELIQNIERAKETQRQKVHEGREAHKERDSITAPKTETYIPTTSPQATEHLTSEQISDVANVNALLSAWQENLQRMARETTEAEKKAEILRERCVRILNELGTASKIDDWEAEPILDNVLQDLKHQFSTHDTDILDTVLRAVVVAAAVTFRKASSLLCRKFGKHCFVHETEELVPHYGEQTWDIVHDALVIRQGQSVLKSTRIGDSPLLNVTQVAELRRWVKMQPRQSVSQVPLMESLPETFFNDGHILAAAFKSPSFREFAAKDSKSSLTVKRCERLFQNCCDKRFQSLMIERWREYLCRAVLLALDGKLIWVDMFDHPIRFLCSVARTPNVSKEALVLFHKKVIGREDGFSSVVTACESSLALAKTLMGLQSEELLDVFNATGVIDLKWLKIGNPFDSPDNPMSQNCKVSTNEWITFEQVLKRAQKGTGLTML